MGDSLERNVERLIREGYEPVRPDPRLERELLPRMREWQDELLAGRRRIRPLVWALAAAAGLAVAAAPVWLLWPHQPPPLPAPVQSSAPLPAPLPEEAARPVPPITAPVDLPPPPAPEPPKAEVPPPRPPTEPSTVPPPAEEIPPSPPAPAPPRKAAPRTRVVMARIEAAQGKVLVVDEGRRSAARAGMDLLSGQDLETEGAARADLAFADGTALEIGASTTLEIGEAGLELNLPRGTLTARRKSEAPLRVRTPHANIEVPAAFFSVACAGDSTRVEVRQGRARVTRAGDAARVDLSAQQVAVVAAPGTPLAAAPLVQDQAAVDAAVRKGTEFLLKAGVSEKSEELVLWTLLHAGVPEDDPKFQSLLKEVTEAPLEKTYNVALLAMVLEELERVKHQPLLARCGQFLADNQARNGQWGYGEPTAYADYTGTPRADVATGPRKPGIKDYGGGPRAKPAVRRTIPIKKQKDGPATGDNSNTQYAALGVRACHDAGIVFPREVIERAERAWRQGKIVKEAGGYAEAGWCYEAEGNGHKPYGSITAGAVGSLAIYDYIRDGEKARSWKRDRDVNEGIRWIARNFTVTFNPGSFKDREDDTPCMHYYYLYALERAGVLCGTEAFGARRWYAEGAAFLLGAQRPDGSWSAEHKSNRPLWDTCWAILFLRRATRPLDVASVDAGKAAGK